MICWYIQARRSPTSSENDVGLMNVMSCGAEILSYEPPKKPGSFRTPSGRPKCQGPKWEETQDERMRGAWNRAPTASRPLSEAADRPKGQSAYRARRSIWLGDYMRRVLKNRPEWSGEVACR